MSQLPESTIEYPVGWTNNILQRFESPKREVFYVPAYLRMKIKNIIDINLQEMKATINCVLLLTVLFGGLDKQKVNLLRSQIMLRLLNDRPIQLKAQKITEIVSKVDNQKKTINFTIRKKINCKVEGDAFWTPFDLISLVLSISMQSIERKNYVIKFNLMDHSDKQLKQSYIKDVVYCSYDLAETRMAAHYNHTRHYQNPNDRQRVLFEEVAEWTLQTIGQHKIHNFQYAHFIIPLYRYPSITVTTIVVPLMLLSFINLAAFFQDSTLSDRVATIASLVLSINSLIPTIRKIIPLTPRIVFIQLFVYTEIGACCLCLIHSFLVRDVSDYKLNYSQDVLFLFLVVILITSIVILVVMFLLHKVYWQPSYNPQGDNKTTNFDLNPKEWNNSVCDKHFASVLQNIGKKPEIHSTSNQTKQKPKYLPKIDWESNK